ncbi:hypothetical protein J6590_050863 [Homalodisca vitripennis]|nr:hypothetical protein J6590_050863 [Homalodisca vitripennis]
MNRNLLTAGAEGKSNSSSLRVSRAVARSMEKLEPFNTFLLSLSTVTGIVVGQSFGGNLFVYRTGAKVQSGTTTATAFTKGIGIEDGTTTDNEIYKTHITNDKTKCETIDSEGKTDQAGSRNVSGGVDGQTAYHQ